MNSAMIIGIAVAIIIIVAGGAYYYIRQQKALMVCPACAAQTTCPTCPVCATPTVCPVTPTYSVTSGIEHSGDDIRLYRDISIEDAKLLCNADPSCKAFSYNTEWTGQQKYQGGAILKKATGINNTAFSGQFYVKN